MHHCNTWRFAIFSLLVFSGLIPFKALHSSTEQRDELWDGRVGRKNKFDLNHNSNVVILCENSYSYMYEKFLFMEINYLFRCGSRATWGDGKSRFCDSWTTRFSQVSTWSGISLWNSFDDFPRWTEWVCASVGRVVLNFLSEWLNSMCRLTKYCM